LNILAECFPDREIIGISATDLIWSLELCIAKPTNSRIEKKKKKTCRIIFYKSFHINNTGYLSLVNGIFFPSGTNISNPLKIKLKKVQLVLIQICFAN
jgi:hypothetical protein